MTIVEPRNHYEMASPRRNSRVLDSNFLPNQRSNMLGARQSSSHNFAAVAAAALTASTQSLDHVPPPPASPQNYARSPGHQRYPAYGSHNSPSPTGAMYSPAMSPKHGANLYWTARVSFYVHNVSGCPLVQIRLKMKKRSWFLANLVVRTRINDLLDIFGFR